MRGERLELLVNKTENLNTGVISFRYFIKQINLFTYLFDANVIMHILKIRNLGLNEFPNSIAAKFNNFY